MDRTFTSLSFDTIRQMLAEHACTQGAIDRLLALTPYLSEMENRSQLGRTDEARRLLDALGTPPLSSMLLLEKLLPTLKTGGMLTPSELLGVNQFLAACRRMKSYLERGAYLQADLTNIAYSLIDLPELSEEIERCIRGEAVDSHASKALLSLRQKIETLRGQIKMRLNTMLSRNRKWFSDALVVARGDRLALPVRKECRNQVSGTVLDVSASGSTYFIEPASVGKMQQELSETLIEEDNEVRRILYTLTALCQDALPTFENNRDALETLDFAFAKGKLSAQMHAISPTITLSRSLRLTDARHPLLPIEQAVPLNLQMDAEQRGVIITGPNTGGKTVALKTVGLLTLMAQSGLHVPAAAATLPMCSGVLCDIGDGQSISENLSTFSSHMTNILGILAQVNDQSLVLLDELGSGTDPMEGMGIAIAILEALREKHCLLVVTTHYPEVKEYAQSAEGLVNARMAFDRESLLPLYRLEVGEAGESCALYIAKKLGFSAALLERAYQEAYRNRTRKPGEAPTDLLDGLAPASAATVSTSAAPRVKAQTVPKVQSSHALQFSLGDSVLVYPGRQVGLVYAPANDHGEVGVQIQGKKQRIAHKRLKITARAKDMYPEDYDFSIVFDTVENRKARHQLSKGHRPEYQIVHEQEES